MSEKKQNNYTTPDLTKLQVVTIDEKTKIYIALNADPEEARNRYFSRIGAKSKLYFANRKPIVPR